MSFIKRFFGWGTKNKDVGESHIVFKLVKFNIKKWKDNEYESSISLMQENEKERFKHINGLDIKRSVSMHLLTKSILGKLHNKSFSEINFERTEENKPIWMGYDKKKYPCLNFNISHSGNWGVAGVCSHGIIGVDVQEIKYLKKNEIANFLINLRKCFTFKEWSYITLQNEKGEKYLSHTTEEDLENFLRNCNKKKKLNRMKERLFCYWILKESFIKAIGSGLYFQLSRIQFLFENLKKNDSLIGKKPFLYIDGEIQKGWTFKTFKLDSTHLAAVSIGPVYYELITDSFKKSLSFDDLDVAHIENERLKSLKDEYSFDFTETDKPLEKFQIENSIQSKDILQPKDLLQPALGY